MPDAPAGDALKAARSAIGAWCPGHEVGEPCPLLQAADALIAAARAVGAAEEREAIVTLALGWQAKQRRFAGEAERDGENHLRHLHDGAADILTALIRAIGARSPSSWTEETKRGDEG